MFVWRGLTAQVMSFILDEYSNWQPAQVAFLLGAFSLGYVPLQIPYSLLARRTGQKILCTVNLLAQAAGCFLIPAAARGGPTPLSVVFGLLGVFQGSRVPCQQVLERRWVPDGLERVRHQQLKSWASQGVSLMHLTLIPILAKRVGWRFMPRWYATQSLLMAAIWQAFAVDHPSQWRGRPVLMSPDERQLLDSIGCVAEAPAPSPSYNAKQSERADKVCTENKSVQPEPLPAAAALCDKELPALSIGQLFRIRKIQGMMAMGLVESLFPTFTKTQALWTLYFSERYGLPMEQVLLRQAALIAPMSIGNALLEGQIETRLIKRGWAPLDIRRRCSTAGFGLQILLKVTKPANLRPY